MSDGSTKHAPTTATAAAAPAAGKALGAVASAKRLGVPTTLAPLASNPRRATAGASLTIPSTTPMPVRRLGSSASTASIGSQPGQGRGDASGAALGAALGSASAMAPRRRLINPLRSSTGMPVAPLSPSAAAEAEAAAAAAAAEAAEAAELAALSPRSQEKLLAHREVAENHARIQREKEAKVAAEAARVAAAAAASAAALAAAQAQADEAARLAAEKAEAEEDARTAIMMDQILAARGIKRTEGVDQAERDALQAFREAERENREAERRAAAGATSSNTLAAPAAGPRSSRRRTLNDADSIANTLSKQLAAGAAAAPSHPVGSGLLLPPIGSAASASSSKNPSRVVSRRVSPRGSRAPSAQGSRAASTQGSRAHSRERQPAPAGSAGAHGDVKSRHVKSKSLHVSVHSDLLQSLKPPRSGTGSAAASGTSSPTALPRSMSTSMRGSATAGSSPKKGPHAMAPSGPAATRHAKHASLAAADDLLRVGSAARVGAAVVAGNSSSSSSSGVDASRRRRNSLPHVASSISPGFKVTLSTAGARGSGSSSGSGAALSAHEEQQQLLREFAPGFMTQVSGLEKLLAQVKLTADMPIVSKTHREMGSNSATATATAPPATTAHYEYPAGSSSSSSGLSQR